MIQNVIYYNKFSLTQIQSETIENVPVADSKSYCRLEIPSNQSNINALFKKGYVFVERTLGVSINLSKDEIDYKKLIRFDIKKVQANNEDVLRIAIDSFPTDRRFHIRPEYDNSISEIIIRDWVSKLNEIYVCVYKDKIIGFIDLRLELNDYLRNFGGHIGYSIRPIERRKGYNKINLYLCLLEAQKNGLDEVLITCADYNDGSRNSIKSFDGVLEKTTYDELDGETMELYSKNLVTNIQKTTKRK